MADDIFEECDYSGLAKAFCAHCKGDLLGDERSGPSVHVEDDDPEGYEIKGKPFNAVYRGRCAINDLHVVKVNTRVARVQHVGNPFIIVPGVACSACIRQLPTAR